MFRTVGREEEAGNVHRPYRTPRTVGVKSDVERTWTCSFVLLPALSMNAYASRSPTPPRSSVADPYHRRRCSIKFFQQEREESYPTTAEYLTLCSNRALCYKAVLLPENERYAVGRVISTHGISRGVVDKMEIRCLMLFLLMLSIEKTHLGHISPLFARH